MGQELPRRRFQSHDRQQWPDRINSPTHLHQLVSRGKQKDQIPQTHRKTMMKKDPGAQVSVTLTDLQWWTTEEDI